MKKKLLILTCIALYCLAGAQTANDLLNLSKMQSGVKSRHFSSYDTTGGTSSM